MFSVGSAPGYRDTGSDGGSGAPGNVGHCGYSYSSSVSGTNSIFLDFHVQGLYTSYMNGRGHGFQLRCLSE